MKNTLLFTWFMISFCLGYQCFNPLEHNRPRDKVTITAQKLNVLGGLIRVYQERFLHVPASLTDLVRTDIADEGDIKDDWGNEFLYEKASPTNVLVWSNGPNPNLRSMDANSRCISYEIRKNVVAGGGKHEEK